MAKNTKTSPKAKTASPKAKLAKDETRVAWNAGKEMTLHGAQVGKKTYRSVWAAFLGEFGEKSPDCARRGRHIAFRSKLKALGVGKSLDYTRVDGKKVAFKLIALR